MKISTKEAKGTIAKQKQYRQQSEERGSTTFIRSSYNKQHANKQPHTARMNNHEEAEYSDLEQNSKTSFIEVQVSKIKNVRTNEQI